MPRTITSSQISFIDTTDSRQLTVHISSNLPTVQIKNLNTGAFSPDWTVNNLVLQATTYLDSQNVSTSVSYVWYRKYGNGTESPIPSSNSRTLTINTNLTHDSGIVTYRCVATYQVDATDSGVTAMDQIIFTRTESGLNGNPGASAAQVQAQYSSNGTTWSSLLQGDSQYIRFSYDGGNTWTTSIKVKGQDGTGVAIKGTAYTTEITLSAGMTISTLYSDSAKTTVINKNSLVEGDSYIVNGYLCVFNDSSDNFICTGVIQGPQGNPGTSSYTFIRYATSSAGANMSTSPSGKTYIGIAVTSTNSAPASASAYTWSKYVGEDAKSITLSANSQIFKVNTNNVASPSTITVVGTPINTSITSWQYSTDGGANFVTTLPNGVAINGNQVTITGASITANSITVRATDGTYSDTLTVFKVLDGAIGATGSAGTSASLAFLTNEHISFVANSSGQVTGQTITTNVVAYTGANKVTPVLGTITGLPIGMTITTGNITTVSNEKVIPIVITANATFGSSNSNSGIINIPITSPVSTNLKLNWSKINTGAQGNTGVGISTITEYYAVSSSNTTAPTTWQSTPPTMTTTNKYLWNYETITYSNNTTHDTEKRVIGAYGNTGSAGTSVTITSTSVTYQAGSSGTTQPTGSWVTTIPTVNNGQYLWTKTVVTYSNGTSTESYGVSYKGTNGSNGTSVTISSTSVTYQASANGTTTPTGTWTTTIPNVTNGQFLWTRTIVTYSNGTTTTSYSVSYKGTNGAKGDTGNGISSIVNYYLATTASSGVTTSTSGWTTTIQTITATNKYLWNYEVVNYTNGSNNPSAPCIIGVYGDKGNAGSNGITYYTWIKYADTPTSGMSDSPDGKAYMGIAHNKTTATESTTYADYTWSLIKGSNGSNGANGITYYTWVKYADDANGTNMSSSPTGKYYIGLAYNKTSSTASSTASDYQWSLFRGSNGVNGQTYYVHIRYSANADGSNFTTTPQSNTQYMGTCSTTSSTAPTTNTSYTWALIKGATGASGQNGTNGTSYYVHIRYRANTDDTTLTTTPNDYMGVYSGTSSTAPTSVSSYTWYNVKGSSGAPGADSITFQIYSNNGYILSKDLQSITLQTFAYKGNQAITSGATYQWASSTGNGWTNISGATNAYFDVNHSDVSNNKSYMCTMTFEGLTYSYVVTVEDKTDIKQTFTSKPLSYSTGDIWIVGSDYVPSGVEVGTILIAEHTRNTYTDADWILATKYDQKMNVLANDIAKYNQYFSFDTTNGMTMTAVDANGNRSPFSTTLSNSKLSFNQGAQEVAYISNNKLNITEAEIVSPLTVTGKYSGNTVLQAPTINLGNFSLVIENNGSLSIVANR